MRGFIIVVCAVVASMGRGFIVAPGLKGDTHEILVTAQDVPASARWSKRFTTASDGTAVQAGVMRLLIWFTCFTFLSTRRSSRGRFKSQPPTCDDVGTEVVILIRSSDVFSRYDK